MFGITANANKFRVQYFLFDLVYTQPGVEFSTEELAQKHKQSLILNADVSFVTKHWTESKLVDLKEAIIV